MVEETANGEEDDKERHDEGPDVGDSRSGSDGIWTGDETLASQAVMDDLTVVKPHTCICHLARHHEVIVQEQFHYMPVFGIMRVNAVIQTNGRCDSIGLEIVIDNLQGIKGTGHCFFSPKSL